MLSCGAHAADAATYQIRCLRNAVDELAAAYPGRYPAAQLRRRLADLDAMPAGNARDRALAAVRRAALLANPLLGFERLLVVKRKVRAGATRDRELGLPSNGSSNCALTHIRYDNELAVLSPVRPDAALRTLYRPPDRGYVGETDVHWEGDRLLFSRSNRRNWGVWEVRADGSGLRQVSKAPADVDCYDACYLPNDRIVFGCTASYQSVPCFHGSMPACHLYVMDSDGGTMRQLCYDQDLDLHPSVLNNGQILYNRWDYTGVNHVFMRQLMVMNPDGTGQRAVHGSNSWFPNALYYSRAVPGRSGLLVSILTGYHVPRTGQLVTVDLKRGWHGSDGIVQRISGRGDRIEPRVQDKLTANEWPKFAHPFPLTDPACPGLAGKYFLVACQPTRQSAWGIYLADVFDNLILLREESGYALLEPVPLAARPRPPIAPDRVDLSREDAVVYLHDVYRGPGLAGVPRGTAKRLRVFAYHFGYRSLAGPDKIGYAGPWEVMRILGTVPLEPDGSAIFRVPANTPIAVQPLDGEGKAMQLMRSWFTAMPGEALSCVGCHEAPADSAMQPRAAAKREPRDLVPWRGPARGFSFVREVQPVLDRLCVSCHDGRPACPDLRSASAAGSTRAWPFGYASRLHKSMKSAKWQPRFSPAYDALVRRIRRVSIEDDVSLLLPGEYHADTSPLIQMLQKGHQGVRLDAEAWDRLVTWIDLNAPYHGTWGEVFSPIPGNAHKRRMALQAQYGGPRDDPEAVPDLPGLDRTPRTPAPMLRPSPVAVSKWPFVAWEATRRQQAAAVRGVTASVDLGAGVKLQLTRIPAGRFVMGDAAGEPDEWPPHAATVEQPFWMGVHEITNRQYRRFDSDHDCRYYVRRYPKEDSQGMPLNGPAQPAVRVSWDRATAFCRWLSRRTGLTFELPTETQWEWACRAGAATPLAYGTTETDFGPWANVGDRTFSRGPHRGGRQTTGGLPHHLLEGAALCDARFDDQTMVTAAVGSYRPNAWGLFDMHGNAAEWTRTRYGPYVVGSDPVVADVDARMVVRGGSFFDHPKRCRSAFRLAYPPWRRVFNVGFRVVCTSAALK